MADDDDDDVGDDDQGEDRPSEATSEILCWEEDDVSQEIENSDTSRDPSNTPSPISITQAQLGPVTTRSDMARTISFDDPTDELELLEIDEEEVWEKQRCAVQTRLAEKWRRSYSLGGSLQAARRGSANTAAGARVDSSSLMKPFTTPQHENLGAQSTPTRNASHSTIKVVNKWTGRGFSDPQISEFKIPARESVRRSVEKGKLTTGSQAAPILIDDDEASGETMCNSKAKLQALR
ncbi:hypothetical protein J3R30DRAFT_3709878 [Lentinula aciculospora]|uniref:Uncharacterized protein n=1 Tax=Lentinula aciculospora TaxID=153920 RepID=A0A9W9DI04_9AGAR|nr:hypothetical protein J3R30DRAFT_3709878 [Lentinula aciculospora]